MITQHHLPKLIASLLLFPLVTISACTPAERQFGSGGSGGSGGSTSSSSSSSGTLQCNVDTDCGASSECQSFACIDGQCNVTFAQMGTLVEIQEIGDCQSNVCDGNGFIVKTEDLADPVDDGNPCTLEACIDGTTQHGAFAAGTDCNGSWFCDGFGLCVECLDGAHCPSQICSQSVCATAECTDMVKNGVETDVDCGGFQCPRCGAGATCAGDPDCNSLICKSGLCTEATCYDDVFNGQETSVDCGGPTCKPCPAGYNCKAGLDCTSKVCEGGVCQEPTCYDKVTNGSETDVDCGGPCIKCGNGQHCYLSKDCASNNCCVAEPGLLGTCISPGQSCNITLHGEITQ